MSRDIEIDDRDGWIATSEEVQRWRQINQKKFEPQREYFDPHWKFRQRGWIAIGLLYAAVAVGGYWWLFERTP